MKVYKYSSKGYSLMFCVAMALIQFSVNAQQYIIEASQLNVRYLPTTNSEVLGKLDKGDTVSVLEKQGDWLKIDYNNAEGYISKKYAVEITVPGFIAGFSEGFVGSFVYVFLIIAGIDFYRTKRIKDARYKEGYRKLPFSGFDLLKFAFYSIIICAVIGLFTGTYAWIIK